MIDFVNLHTQTSYSLLDSLIEPKALFARLKELGQTAVAITDHGSLAATWECFKLSQENDIKLIIGCEVYFQDELAAGEKLKHLILLAKNAIGYRNLLTLNRKGFDQSVSIGKRVYSVIDWKLLEKYSEGLICLTGCGNGLISQPLMNKKNELAEQNLLRLKQIFGDNLGIEVQANNMRRGSNIFNDEIDQIFLNRQLINLGKKYQIKVVPTCNAHYLTKEDSSVHDILLAIGSHQPIYSNYRLRYPVADFYLKTGDELKNFFSRNYGEDFAKELCENSLYFANLCEKPDWIDPKYSNPAGKELPIFPVKDEEKYTEFLEWVKKCPEDWKKLDEDKLYLRYKCYSRFEIIKQNLSQEKHQEYLDRINEELDTLEYQGFSSYMLIVADYVRWCKKNDIPTGPGRGSVGGCIVAYLLEIHQADPIQYGLIFARFQNKERKSPPDIDQDVSAEHREKVCNHIINKYGYDHVASISNINRITPKVFVRDVARACELGGSKEEAVKVGNSVADIIPNDIYSSIDNVLKIPLFAEYCKRYPEFIKAGQILNKYRAFSTHAAAMVVSKRPLVGLVPLRKDKDGVIAIEYTKDPAEENGLIKMDVLGLSTLDLIEKTIKLVKQSGKELSLDYLNYDKCDEKTYELITKGDTFGVFQFGTSAGTIDLCKRVKPKNIEDLAIITTLARPAAANIRNDFILAREGKREVQLLDSSLEGAFKKTFGFGLFDESILQLGRDVAGWDYNSADRIRKMIKEKKKNPDKDKKLRSEFIEGAVNKGINQIIAERIWDEEIKKFASYTFNKSHAVMYSFLSYQTAYLKAHYPVEFLLANLMAEVKSNAPVAKLNIEKIKRELKAHKIKIIAPNINSSQLTYTLEENKLITGLDALKFVGEDAINDIISKRPFKDFFDFMSRVDSKKVRANTIQALIACGCLDSFKISRKLMFLYCSDYRKKLQVWLKRHDPITEEFIYPWPNEGEWPISELYALEQFYLGESFICKPTDAYGNFFKDPHTLIAEVKKNKDRTPIKSIRGIIRDFFEFKVKKETSKFYGRSMVKLLIEDLKGDRISITIFPDRWDTLQKRIKMINSKVNLEIGLAIHFCGTTNIYEDEVGIIFDQLFNISPIPNKPNELKAKKVNLKELKNKTTENNSEKSNDINNLFEEIEDSLYDEGLIEVNEFEDIE